MSRIGEYSVFTTAFRTNSATFWVLRRWGPLMGPGKAFDMNRFFIICLNVMGSPYGTASPVTVDPQTGCLYGPEFPTTTIRDDVR